MNNYTILAEWFTYAVDTDGYCGYIGARYPVDGRAVSLDGRIFVQDITDHCHWTWRWYPTREKVEVPEALKSVMQDIHHVLEEGSFAYAAWRRGEKGAFWRMVSLWKRWASLEEKAGRLAHERGLI